MTIDKKKVQRWLDARWVDLSMLKREKTIAMRPTRNKFQSRVTRWMTYRTELLLWFCSLLMPILPVIIIILSFRFTFFLRNFDSFEFNTQNEKQIACKQKKHNEPNGKLHLFNEKLVMIGCPHLCCNFHIDAARTYKCKIR